MNKKERTGIFVRITKGKAEKRLNKEIKEYMKKKQKEYGGELTPEEKKELRQQYISKRRSKIIQEEAKKARAKVVALGMISALGIGAVGGYALGAHNSKILGITDGKEKIEVNMDEVEKDVEIQNLVNEEGKTSKHDIFVQGLKDQASTEEVEQNEESLTEEEKTEKEINELKSKEDVLNYFKNMYIEEYEKATGDDKLTTADIQIQTSSQSYVYELDDGTIVTHGDLPANTESAIKNDGHEYTDLQNKLVYKVSRVDDGTVLDAATANGDEMKKVVIGDKYSEMKDYDSILSKMGPITRDIYKLMNSIEDTRADSTGPRTDLLEHVLEYKQNNKTVDQMENDERG